MLDKELIKREIDKLPEDVLGELLDFIQFLETKREGGSTHKGVAGAVHWFLSEDLGQ